MIEDRENPSTYICKECDEQGDICDDTHVLCEWCEWTFCAQCYEEHKEECKEDDDGQDD